MEENKKEIGTEGNTNNTKSKVSIIIGSIIVICIIVTLFAITFESCKGQKREGEMRSIVPERFEKNMDSIEKETISYKLFPIDKVLLASELPKEELSIYEKDILNDYSIDQFELIVYREVDLENKLNQLDNLGSFYHDNIYIHHIEISEEARLEVIKTTIEKTCYYLDGHEETNRVPYDIKYIIYVPEVEIGRYIIMNNINSKH